MRWSSIVLYHISMFFLGEPNPFARTFLHCTRSIRLLAEQKTPLRRRRLSLRLPSWNESRYSVQIKEYNLYLKWYDIMKRRTKHWKKEQLGLKDKNLLWIPRPWPDESCCCGKWSFRGGKSSASLFPIETATVYFPFDHSTGVHSWNVSALIIIWSGKRRVSRCTRGKSSSFPLRRRR